MATTSKSIPQLEISCSRLVFFCNIATSAGCVDPDGAGPLALGDGQFNSPRGIAVDISRNVFVTDEGNNRIQKFDSKGNFLLKFGGPGYEHYEMIPQQYQNYQI